MSALDLLYSLLLLLVGAVLIAAVLTGAAFLYARFINNRRAADAAANQPTPAIPYAGDSLVWYQVNADRCRARGDHEGEEFWMQGLQDYMETDALDYATAIPSGTWGR